MTEPLVPPGPSSSAPRRRRARSSSRIGRVVLGDRIHSLAVTNALLCSDAPGRAGDVERDRRGCVHGERTERARHRAVLHGAAALGRHGGRERHADRQRVGHDDVGRGGRAVVVGEQRLGERRTERDRVGRLGHRRATDRPTAAPRAPSHTPRTRTCRWSGWWRSPSRSCRRRQRRAESWRCRWRRSSPTRAEERLTFAVARRIAGGVAEVLDRERPVRRCCSACPGRRRAPPPAPGSSGGCSRPHRRRLRRSRVTPEGRDRCPVRRWRRWSCRQSRDPPRRRRSRRSFRCAR